MPLLTERTAYKPFEYPWAFEAWERQQQVHWMPKEIPLHEDIQDWKSKLGDAEKNLLTQIFRFFTQADVDINNCYMRKYASVFRPPEVAMMLSAFSNMETIHITAYSYLLDTLGMPETEYSAFMQYKEMKAKHEQGLMTFIGSPVMDIEDYNNLELAATLAMFGAFTEGLQLFASFAILMNFPRFNKMKGMGQIVTYSVRDETLHCESIIRLFHTLVQEKGLDRSKLDPWLVALCRKVVENEDAFIDLCFEMGPVEGLTAAEVKAYVRYIANRRLQQLGITGFSYAVKGQPLPWMDAIQNGHEHANFFETRVTEYSRAATKGEWGDVNYSPPTNVHMLIQDGCPWCVKAKDLLKRVGLGHFTLDDYTNRPDQKNQVYFKTGRSTLPLIYFDGLLVGGYDDLTRALGCA